MKIKSKLELAAVNLLFSNICSAAQYLEIGINVEHKGDPQVITYSVNELSNLITNENLIEKSKEYSNRLKIYNNYDLLDKKDEFFNSDYKTFSAFNSLSIENKKDFIHLNSTKIIVNKLASFIADYLMRDELITDEQIEFLNKIDTLRQLLQYGHTFESNLDAVIASANSSLTHKLKLKSKAPKTETPPEK